MAAREDRQGCGGRLWWGQLQEHGGLQILQRRAEEWVAGSKQARNRLEPEGLS